MNKNYWIVINTLADVLEKYYSTGKIDRKNFKEATFQLNTDLDRCLSGNLPSEELKCLISVLNRLNYDVLK